MNDEITGLEPQLPDHGQSEITGYEPELSGARKPVTREIVMLLSDTLARDLGTQLDVVYNTMDVMRYEDSMALPYPYDKFNARSAQLEFNAIHYRGKPVILSLLNFTEQQDEYIFEDDRDIWLTRFRVNYTIRAMVTGKSVQEVDEIINLLKLHIGNGFVRRTRTPEEVAADIATISRADAKLLLDAMVDDDVE